MKLTGCCKSSCALSRGAWRERRCPYPGAGHPAGCGAAGRAPAALGSLPAVTVTARPPGSGAAVHRAALLRAQPTRAPSVSFTCAAPSQQHPDVNMSWFWVVLEQIVTAFVILLGFGFTLLKGSWVASSLKSS